MKKLLLAILLSAATSYADPMTFSWDAVTSNTDGSPVGPVIYRLYKKSPTGPYILLASRISTSYTWTAPQLGDWTFTVRALNKNGESADSNTVRVTVNSCWQEVK